MKEKKMHKKEILIGISDEKKMSRDFIRAWKRTESGLPPELPIHRLHFADMSTLFKYLSPRRFELLQHLRSAGPLSIRKLAQELRRDYKNVHSDIKDLHHLGLVKEAKDRRFTVPWDTLITELPLHAKAV